MLPLPGASCVSDACKFSKIAICCWASWVCSWRLAYIHSRSPRHSLGLWSTPEGTAKEVQRGRRQILQPYRGGEGSTLAHATWPTHTFARLSPTQPPYFNWKTITGICYLSPLLNFFHNIYDHTACSVITYLFLKSLSRM